MLVFALPILLVFLFVLERLLYGRLWKRGLESDVRFSSTIVRSGEGVEISEKCVNNSFLPLTSLSLEWNLERQFSPFTVDGKPFSSSTLFSLPGRRMVEHRKEIGSLKRGIYTISGCRITTTDLFSLDEHSLTFSSNTSLHVLPQRREGFSSSYAYRGFLGTVESTRMSADDPFAVKAIRPYVTTDSMKTINWKASAKTGKLKVNQYDWTTEESVQILLDLSGGSEEERERLIEYVSTFSSLLLSRGVNVSLRGNGRSAGNGKFIKVEKGSGRGHSLTLDLALSEIKISGSDGLPRPEIRDDRALPVLFSVSLGDMEREDFLLSSEGRIFLLKGKGGKDVFILEGDNE